MKKILFFIFILSFLILPNLSKAEILYEQNLENTGNWNVPYGFEVAQTLGTNLTGSFNEVKIWASYPDNYNTFLLSVAGYDNSNYTSIATSTIKNLSLTGSSNGEYLSFIFDSPISFLSNKYYLLYFACQSCSAPYDNQSNIKGSVFDNFSSGEFYYGLNSVPYLGYNPNLTGVHSTSTISDMFFQIGTDLSDTPVLTINSPSSNSTLQNPINFSGSTTNSNEFKIYYGNTSSTATNLIHAESNPNAGTMTWDFSANFTPNKFYWFKTIAENNATSTIDYRQIYLSASTSTQEWYFGEPSYFNLTSTSTYYVNNVPAIFGTSTPSVIYTSITNLGQTILSPAVNFMAPFVQYFSTDKAENLASTTAGAINNVYSAGQGINQVFSDFPIFEIVLLLVLVNLGILIFKGVWYLIKIIR